MQAIYSALCLRLVGPNSTRPQHTLQSTYNQYIKPSNCLIGPLVGFHLNLHKNKNKQLLAGKRSRIFAHAIANFFLVNARRPIDYKRLFRHTCIRFGAITKASLWLNILLIQQLINLLLALAITA